MASLNYMDVFLAKIPSSFPTIQKAIQWTYVYFACSSSSFLAGLWSLKRQRGTVYEVEQCIIWNLHVSLCHHDSSKMRPMDNTYGKHAPPSLNLLHLTDRRFEANKPSPDTAILARLVPKHVKKGRLAQQELSDP